MTVWLHVGKICQHLLNDLMEALKSNTKVDIIYLDL